MTESKRILIVGGVAGGASAAARARRLCEHCRIILFEKGPYVSFANCGLPYHVGDVIREEEKLLVATPKLFRDRFNIEVRTSNEVVSIDRERREIEVKDVSSGRTYRELYDALVLSPGARAIQPSWPGSELPGIFVLRTIPDSRRIRSWLQETDARRAVIVGAGYIGLEMAENLVHRGLEVSLLEALPQVLPPLDAEMASVVEEHLKTHGVSVHLANPVTGFERDGNALSVRTTSGAALPAEIVILAIGVRPDVALARYAGLELGPCGGIRVSETLQTSDPRIWAVGDAVEVRDTITSASVLVPLAGPANRQGRIAADNILGRPTRFRGVQATSVCGVFDLIVAATGANEKALQRQGIEDYEKVYLHPGHHVGYYPGAKKINLKLIFRRSDGRILGAQAIGEAGVDRRIDVIAMAIQKEGTVYDLEEAELCYAPQFGAAKDPVNLAGMIAANVLRGDMPVARWEDLEGSEAVLLDVRSAAEYEAGHIPGALHLPIDELRQRLDELPHDREIWLYCGVGQRAYYATRLLAQHGHSVRNLPGGILTYQAFQASRPADPPR